MIYYAVAHVIWRDVDTNRFIVRIMQNNDPAIDDYFIQKRKGNFMLLKNTYHVMPYRAVFSDGDCKKGYVPKTPIGYPEIALPNLYIGDIIVSKDARGWALSNGYPALLLSNQTEVIGNSVDRSDPMDPFNDKKALDLLDLFVDKHWSQPFSILSEHQLFED